MKNQPIKTVEMTRRIRDRMYEETRDLSAEELLRYFRQRSEAATRKVEQRAAIMDEESSQITHQ
jgi:hypothetical protein